MGLIAKLLSFTRASANGTPASDVKVDPGGGWNVTGQHFSPAGEDAVPLPGDYAILAKVDGTGRYSVVGYLDPTNSQTANAGDKRLYARSADGTQEVAQVWIQNDGTVEVVNGNGSVVLQPSGAIEGANGGGYYQLQSGGTFEVNGVTITPDGAITTPTSVTSPVATVTDLTATNGTISGIVMGTHKHPQDNDSDGNIEQDTGGPTNV